MLRSLGLEGIIYRGIEREYIDMSENLCIWFLVAFHIIMRTI